MRTLLAVLIAVLLTAAAPAWADTAPAAPVRTVGGKKPVGGDVPLTASDVGALQCVGTCTAWPTFLQQLAVLVPTASAIDIRTSISDAPNGADYVELQSGTIRSGGALAGFVQAHYGLTSGQMASLFQAAGAVRSPLQAYALPTFAQVGAAAADLSNVNPDAGRVALVAAGTGVSNTFSALQTFGSGVRLPATTAVTWADTFGGLPNLVLQSDNNFVYYGTDAFGALYPVFAHQEHSTNAPLRVAVPLQLLAGGSTGDVSGMSVTAAGGTTPQTLAALSARSGISPLDFKAKCDGVTDDAVPLVAWLSHMGPGVKGILPPSTCVTSARLVLPPAHYGSIVGAGSGSSRILYTGSNTTNDIFAMQGSASAQWTGWTLQGFTVDSSTTMTAGWGIHLQGLVRSTVTDVNASAQDGSSNLWNGFWYDKVDQVSVTNYQAKAQNDGIDVSGTVGNGPKADLHLTSGKVAGCNVGLRVSGAFGGLYVVSGSIESNNVNVVVDTSLAAEGNRELFFDATTAIDYALAGQDVVIADTLADSNAWLEFTGTWVASARNAVPLVQIMPGVKSVFAWNGGTLFNGLSDGLLNQSSTSQVHLFGVTVRVNAGYALNSTVANSNLTGKGLILINNGQGSATPNFVLN